MIIKYKFADGSVTRVEVSNEIGSFIKESRRLEANLSRKERYHCNSIEGSLFEGRELGMSETPEKVLIMKIDSKEMAQRISDTLDKLTDVQRRRLLLCIKGLTVREIARLEGVGVNAVGKSISAARKNFINFFEKGCTKGG